MAIVICCSQDKFFSAAESWLDHHSELKHESVDFIGSLRAFMTKSWFSTLFLTPTHIFSFDRDRFAEAFPQWQTECIESDNNQRALFEWLAPQVEGFIQDDPFLIAAGLIVPGCLNQEPEFDHVNG